MHWNIFKFIHFLRLRQRFDELLKPARVVSPLNFSTCYCYICVIYIYTILYLLLKTSILEITGWQLFKSCLMLCNHIATASHLLIDASARVKNIVFSMALWRCSAASRFTYPSWFVTGRWIPWFSFDLLRCHAWRFILPSPLYYRP